MKSNISKSLNQLKILESLMIEMERKQIGNPEYLIKNIELLDKIIGIFQEFKSDLIGKLTSS